VGAILGLSPFGSRADVLREMVREALGATTEFAGNVATAYGEEMEPVILAAYEARIGTMTHGGGEIVIHPVHDFLAVTPDGLAFHDGMVECKAPYRGTYTHWREKPHYVAQMRLQLDCALRAWCDFAVMDRSRELHVSTLDHDITWLPHNLAALEDFMADYHAALADPEIHINPKQRKRKKA
jgi:hypothetical protein